MAGFAATGAQTVGVGSRDDIHIYLQFLHYLSNAWARNGKWQNGKQAAAIFRDII